MVWCSTENLSDSQCSLNEDVGVCVCVFSTQTFFVWLVLHGFEAGRLWMLQQEGIGEGPAQLHSGRGGGLWKKASRHWE